MNQTMDPAAQREAILTNQIQALRQENYQLKQQIAYLQRFEIHFMLELQLRHGTLSKEEDNGNEGEEIKG